MSVGASKTASRANRAFAGRAVKPRAAKPGRVWGNRPLYDQGASGDQSLQTDPTGYDDGLNWYAYVGNDPLNKSDPTGTFSAEFCDMMCTRYGAPEKQSNDPIERGGRAIVDGVKDVFNSAKRLATRSKDASFADVLNVVLAVVPLPGGAAGKVEMKPTAEVIEKIATGHAFEKHVLAQGEFAGLGLRTTKLFGNHIHNVIDNAMAAGDFKTGARGRSAFWDESTGTIVIRDPRNADGGTAFQPKNGRQYFDNWR